MKRTAIVFFFAILINGCAVQQRVDFSKIQTGMNENEVITKIGSPISTHQQGDTRVLKYENFSRWLSDVSGSQKWNKEEMFVRLKNGKVESFGKLGDFDSTKNPESTYNVNWNTKNQSQPQAGSTDELEIKLLKLEKMYKSGVITEEEFKLIRQKTIQDSISK